MLSSLIGLFAALLALAVASLFIRDLSSQASHRFAAIDGLRGFLALLVFLHHGSAWASLVHGEGWRVPGSLPFSSFGTSSVALFFMITSFLFCSKLIAARAEGSRGIDWLALYVSRVLRLTPLYLCTVAAVFVIVGFETGFLPRASSKDLLEQASRWVLFTVGGRPELNEFSETSVITAAVSWTLPYEWFFYFTLPLLALLFGVRDAGRAPVWLVLSLLCAWNFSSFGLHLEPMYAFVAGAVAALLADSPRFSASLKRPGADALATACFALGFLVFPTDTGLPALMFLFVGFTFVACGVDLFGLLRCRPARALSAASYGIYLWHGILLWIAIEYVLGRERAATLTPLHYWFSVLAVTPFLVALASLSFRFVELPSMRLAPALTAWLRRAPSTTPARAGSVVAVPTARSL